MKRQHLALSLIAAALATPASAQVFWINEFHYDNDGGDIGEFVEVVGPSSFAGDLSTIALTLYNGNGGVPYGGSPHTLDTFTPGASANGFTFYSKNIVSIQNGPPNGADGLSLSQGTTVFQFLSYEGTLTATAGPASGLTSTDIGVSQADGTPGTQPGDTPVGTSLGLTGSGSGYANFTWSVIANDTPGAANVGLTLVPEPHEYALAAALGLAGLVVLRRRQARA